MVVQNRQIITVLIDENHEYREGVQDFIHIPFNKMG